MKYRKDPRHEPCETCPHRSTYILRMTYALFVDQTDRTISRSKNGRANNETSVEEQLRSIVVDHHGHITLLYIRTERRKRENQKSKRRRRRRRRSRGGERGQGGGGGGGGNVTSEESSNWF